MILLSSVTIAIVFSSDGRPLWTNIIIELSLKSGGISLRLGCHSLRFHGEFQGFRCYLMSFADRYLQSSYFGA